jgi:rhamnosyltransferase
MAENALVSPSAQSERHAVVIPVYGTPPSDWLAYLNSLKDAGLLLVIVDNNIEAGHFECLPDQGFVLVCNQNQGGIAGGLNRGIAKACQEGAFWITLLDQDSRIPANHFSTLLSPFYAYPAERLVVGPIIWDEQRQARHGQRHRSSARFHRATMLISSGTTFRSSDWAALGSYHDGLFIDFVDYAWCFRAQARGFCLLQQTEVILVQQFGTQHPNRLCSALGLQLYSPSRHFYSIRNLRWLWLQSYIPLDLKIKETLKMCIKPWLWILFEPNRLANVKAIVDGLLAPLPSQD